MWNQILNLLKTPLYARRLSLVFDQPHDWYLLNELATACGRQADAEGIETLSEPEKALMLIWNASGVISNGGFRYFIECGLDAQATEWAYKTAGCPKKADAVRMALTFFPNGKPSTNFDVKMGQLEEIERTSQKELDALSSIICAKEYESDAHLGGYVRRNRSAFNGRYLGDKRPGGWFREVSPPAADSKARDVAQWLLSISAWVRVKLPGEAEDIFVSELSELPSGPMNILEVRLSPNRSTTDRDLGCMTRLRALEGMKTLKLEETNVSREGLAKIHCWEHLTEINLSGCVLHTEDLETLPALPQLMKLKFPRNVDESALKYLDRFPNLKEFEGINISDEGLSYLASHQRLENLSFVQKNITDTGLAHIGRITSLRELFLWRMPLTDVGIAHLKDLKQLEYLNIENLKIGNASLATIGGLTNLKFLGLDCNAIGDEGVLQLSALVKMEDLRLYKTQVSDEGLRAFANMTSLRHLSLAHTEVTGTGLIHMKNAQRLSELYLYKTKLNDAGAKNLCHLKGLEILWMGENNISDEGLSGLRDLPNLKKLDLSTSNIRGPGLEHLLTLPALEELNLAGNPIGNSALRCIYRMKTLRDLDLSATRIDNAAVEDLIALRQLTSLRLRRSLIEDEVIKELEVAMPECRIHTY